MTSLETARLVSEIEANYAAAKRDRVWIFAYPFAVAAATVAASSGATVLILKLLGAI